MPDVKYNSFKGDLQKGLINLESDIINCMLVSSGYAPNMDTHTNISQVTNQVTGTGYTAGGATLINKTVTVDNANNLAKFDANDIVWADSTITARGAVLYKSGTGNLIAYFDFVTDQISNAGNFTVQWNVNGILTVT